jgi:hypothetical protein
MGTTVIFHNIRGSGLECTPREWSEHLLLFGCNLKWMENVFNLQVKEGDRVAHGLGNSLIWHSSISHQLICASAHQHKSILNGENHRLNLTYVGETKRWIFCEITKNRHLENKILLEENKILCRHKMYKWLEWLPICRQHCRQNNFCHGKV